MKKKAIVITLLVLAVLVGMRIYYWVKPTAKNSSLVRAVPVDAAFFLELNKLNSLNQKISSLPYGNALKQLIFFKKTNDLFTTIQPLINQQKGWKDAFYNQTIITSFHLTRADNFDVLLIADLSEQGKPDLPSLFQALGARLSFTERNFMDEKVYDIHFYQSEKNLTIACIDKTIMMSDESYLVEDAVSQMTGKGSLFEQENFAKLEKSSSENFDAALYLNYKHLGEFMGGFAGVDAQPYVNSISAMADWTELDMTFKRNAVQFSGNTIAANDNWLHWLTKDGVENDEAKKIAPDNTAILMQFGLSSSDSFLTRLSPVLKTNPDFRNYIHPWLGTRMDFLMMEPINDNFLPQSFLVLNTKDEPQANQLLGKWAMEKSGGSVEQFTYKGKTVKRLNINSAFDNYFKSALIHLNNPYFTVLDKQVVFSNSVAQIKLLIDKYTDGNTLLKESTAGKNLSSSGQFSFYIDLSRMKDFFRSLGSDSLAASLDGGFDIVKQFSPLELTYSLNKDFFHTTGTLTYTGGSGVTETYLWKTSLDTTSIIAPQIVSSANGQDKLVVAQDANNQMYLVNKGGDIVWKQMLDGPIVGSISQIDFYSNGELEMVFATTGKIYLVKMDGTPVTNYPITLSSQATSSLNVIDFDGVQQYKFFIACSNGSMYGFEKSGKPLSGWNPNAGVGSVYLPIEFYKASGKEFLMAVTDNGSLLFFSRDGKQVANEIKLKTQFTSPFVFTTGNVLTDVDTTGKVYHFGMDGKMNELELPVEEAGVKAIVTHLGSDSATDYIILVMNRLRAVRNDTAHLFDYNFTGQFPRQVFMLNDPVLHQPAIGVTDAASNQEYLFDVTGKLYSGFPKAGSTAFVLDDLFGNKARVMVTCVNGREIIAYGL